MIDRQISDHNGLIAELQSSELNLAAQLDVFSGNLRSDRGGLFIWLLI